MSEVEQVDGEMLAGVLEAEARGVLVDFWSPWCAPCRTMKPHLARLAVEHAAGWRFVAVNADDDPDTARAFDVRGLPTLVFFRAGEEAHRFAGAATLSSIAGKLEELSA